VPKWAIGRNIYIFAGVNMLAQKHVEKVKPLKYKKLEVVTVPCNMCGECCRNLNSDWHMGVDEKGTCIHLKHEVWPSVGDVYVCDLDGRLPFSCSSGSPSDKPYCCVKLQTVE